jgi:chorismate dehydratase
LNDRFRVSFIEFLNAVPLGWGFLHGSAQGVFDIARDVPSECARKLGAGEADVGLIPVIEYQRIEGLRVIPDIAIASRREVRSVLFVSRRPMGEVTRIAVDTSSRTSVALLQILLTEFYGRDPLEMVPFPPNPRRMLQEFDAALLIGNAALQVRGEGLFVHDLAREWHRFTGLPFVFAFWAVRAGVDLGSDLEAVYRSRKEGLESIPMIAEWYAGRLPISAQEIRHYLSENLGYSLDAEGIRALGLFWELAAKLGVVEKTRPLEFLQRDLSRV